MKTTEPDTRDMNPQERDSIWTAYIVVICGALYVLLCCALVLKNLFCEG